jgi:hypothetical protein
MTFLLLLFSIGLPLLLTPLYDLKTGTYLETDQYGGIDMTDVIYFAENGTYYRVTQEEVPYCFGSY